MLMDGFWTAWKIVRKSFLDTQVRMHFFLTMWHEFITVVSCFNRRIVSTQVSYSTAEIARVFLVGSIYVIASTSGGENNFPKKHGSIAWLKQIFVRGKCFKKTWIDF